MASISKQPNGRKTIQFVAPDGKRRSIRLGKVSLRTAESLKLLVEDLVAVALTPQIMDGETARKVSELSGELADKFAAVGLIVPKANTTVGGFTKHYIEKRVDLKPLTVSHLSQTRKNLIEFFGEDKPMASITAGDADGFRLFLVGKGLADNTIRRRCGRAKQFFHAAGRLYLVHKNPFADIKSAVQANVSRFHFVTQQDIQKVLDACPDAEWRLLVALSRFGGLRCPSEHLALTWDDVNWAEDRILVRSPKTEHHQGGESRLLPLFPELRPYLQEAFELAPPKAVHVISRYRKPNANLRTQFNKIVTRAGLKPWQKPFQNMRSSRETELAGEYPIHVVCKWIGNTELVAAKHYLQVTDEHFEKAVQNPVHSAHATRNLSAHKKPQNPVFSEKDEVCSAVNKCQAPRQGLEPWTKRLTGALAGSSKTSETLFLQRACVTQSSFANGCEP